MQGGSERYYIDRNVRETLSLFHITNAVVRQHIIKRALCQVLDFNITRTLELSQQESETRLEF